MRRRPFHRTVLALLGLALLATGLAPAQEPDRDAQGEDPLADLGHAELMKRALLSIATQDSPSAFAAVERSLERSDLHDDVQVAEAHFARAWLLAQPSFREAFEAMLASADEEKRAELEKARAALVPLGDFLGARALAGPGDLRRRAVYDLGWCHLADGEEWRAQIPEISGAQGQGGAIPGMPPGMTGPGAGAASGADGEEPPDPLEEARKAYGEARGWFVERLRDDWRDEDTRANLELIVRRLRELDEIEKQREEQQSQEQDDSQESSDQDGEPQENEEDQESQDGEEQEESNQEGDPENQEPSDSQGDQEEQQDPSDPGEGEEEHEQPQPEEGQEGDEQEAPRPHEGNPENAERHLTREEVMRLLDKLSEMEEEYRAFQEAMRAARRIPVERDW